MIPWHKNMLIAAVIFFCACMAVSLAIVAHAQAPVQCSSVTPCSVFWTANTEPDIKDYRVYVRKVPALYSSTPLLTIAHPQSALGQIQFMGAIGTLLPGQYAIAVTARDLSLNESARSIEVLFDFVVQDLIPPGIPTLSILQVTIP